MESSRDIKNRIKSITNIKQITRAMEMVAANRLKKAEGRAVSSRPYTQNITSILSNLTGSTPEKAHFVEPKEDVKKIMVLLITSDKGLCGAYNTNAIQNTVKFLKENSDKEITLYLMGKKGNIFFRNRPYTIGEYYTETVEEIGLSSLKAGDHKVSKIVAKTIEDFEGGNYDEIQLFYTKFKTVMKSDPARVRLLPLENIGEDAEGKKAPQGDSILEPSSEAIFSKLLPKYLECQFLQAIFESMTAEYASRRMAMIAASENAEEIIDDLTQVYNKARQEAITKELLEVVSGSEAMAG